MNGPGLAKDLALKCSKAACYLPEKVGRGIALSAGLLTYILWREERKRIFSVIDRICYRRGFKLHGSIDQVVKRVFVHFALTIYEIMRFPVLTKSEIEKKVVFHGLENLDNALAKGKGVVFALPHIGNWELLGAAISHKGYPLNSFFLAQKFDELGGLLDHFRSYTGVKLHDRDRGGIKALKALKHGEILGMVADQDGAQHGVYLDFLGHYVSVPAGPANWSIKTGAALVPIYSLRRGLTGYYDAWFLPAFPEEHSKEHKQKVISRTLKLCNWMEKIILKYPNQYLWFYERFKPRHVEHLTRAKTLYFQPNLGEPWYAG